MQIPHVLALPFPAQGHVIPMVELVRKITQHGVKVTLVNTDYDRMRVVKALSENYDLGDLVDLVSVPDGLKSGEDRNDLGIMFQVLPRVMLANLVELIQSINASTPDNKIRCIIADGCMGWAMEVAEKMGINKRAVFWTSSTATVALLCNIQKLISDGILDGNNGTIKKTEIIQLSPTMPAISTATFVWTCFLDLATQKAIFDSFANINEVQKLADRIICNSAYELEPGAFTLFPEILPVGPLSGSNKLGNQAGNFWPEDSACLSWLD